MKSAATALLIGALLVASALQAQDDSYPTITGYVTRAASSTDFDVNGIRVVCEKNMQKKVLTAQGMVTLTSAGCPDGPFLGEPMNIYGSESDTEHTIFATKIELRPVHADKVAGVAVIDAPPVEVAKGKATGVLRVSADGYCIQIESGTKIAFTIPLQKLSDLKAGDWIVYSGEPDATGMVVAKAVKFASGTVSPKEQELRNKENYDPGAVPESARQSFMSAALKGVDSKQLPAYKDPAMQARVELIGNKLIPVYQRELPDSDATKIHFRFQVVDTTKFRAAMTMSNGIILIPHQVVERMQNDSQLAAILADGIACALEAQAYRDRPTLRSLETAVLASGVAEAFVPGLGVAALAGTERETSIQHREEAQRGRVSLMMLHDAGYDIVQAPVAWWLLAPRKPESVSKIDMPERAANLYQILGAEWHNPATATDKP